MKTKKAVSVQPRRPEAIPESFDPILQSVTEELARSGETAQQVRLGPSLPATEFVDLEAVRLRIAEAQGGGPLRGQAELVEQLRALPDEQTLTYVILDTGRRQAKCYINPDGPQLVGVLWLPLPVEATV